MEVKQADVMEVTMLEQNSEMIHTSTITYNILLTTYLTIPSYAQCAPVQCYSTHCAGHISRVDET